MVAPQLKTLIALDVGDKRIGVATASLAARLPSPAKTINRREQSLNEIAEFIRTQNAVAVILGLPRGLDGQETAQTQAVRQFADQLKKLMTVPIYFQDEALTSKQAEAELAVKGQYNKGAIDAVAATIILNDFILEHPEMKA